MFDHVMFVTLFVSDQDRALEFYTKLGFQKRADNRWAEGRFLTIALDAQPFEILLWPGRSGAGDRASGAPEISVPGLLFIHTNDLRRDFAALKDMGVPMEEPEPEAYPYGLRATAIDPDGNRISLRQSGS